MTREDRQKRDLEMASRLALDKRRRTDDPGTSSTSTSSSAGPSKESLRPGDPGWVCRARVPMVDNKEFVQRPEWQSNEDMSQTTKKGISKLEKHKRKFADKRKIGRMQHAVKISLEGKNMAL